MKKFLEVGRQSLVVSVVCFAAIISLAAPLAPVEYVDKKVDAAVKEAKKYTDEHAPKVDLSGYVTKDEASLHVDSATNVVWKSVWSNGVEYVYAYSNNTNILKGVTK